MNSPLPRHLGGHLNRTHLDEGALDWAIKTFGVRSFLDIGCGPGGMVELALEKNLEALGIDGDDTLERQIKNNFVVHDYSRSSLKFDRLYDLIWCCEFVEHVEKQYVSNFVETFLCGRWLILTFAPPGAPGHHHVNCQDQQYWIDTLEGTGKLRYSPALTGELRAASNMKRNFVRDHGLFFESSTA